MSAGGPAFGNSAVALIAGSFLDPIVRIWPGARIGEYLAASDARRHLWHACLAAEAGIFWPKDEDSAELSYARFTAWKSKFLLMQAYAVEARGLFGVLGRLGPTARAPQVYRALVEAMAAEDAGALFLSQSREPKNELILAVAALPPRLRSKRVLKELAGKREASEEAALFAWGLARLETLHGAGAADAILAATKPLKALNEIGATLPFPAPPWPGDERLMPVTSPERLAKIADDFENCLSGFAGSAILEVRIGQKYFYEWRGEEPGLLELTAWPCLGWRLTQAKGPKNAALSAPTQASILAALAKCPSFAPVWPTDERELLEGL